MFKPGDVVEVMDGSYAMEFDAGTGTKLTHGCIAREGRRSSPLWPRWTTSQRNRLIGTRRRTTLSCATNRAPETSSSRRSASAGLFRRLTPRKPGPSNSPGSNCSLPFPSWSTVKLEHGQATTSCAGVIVVRQDTIDESPYLPSTEKDIAEIESLLALRRNMKGQ